MSTRRRLIVICGPTASGKTDLAVSLAGRYSCPILSADSRQVYRGMAIGTAQPSAEQLSAVRHYFIADREVEDWFSAGMFEHEAIPLLERLFGSHETVVAVGGAGMYVDALCHGLDDLPEADPEIRSSLAAETAERGLPHMVQRLRELDPQYASEVDVQNPARVLRALEVCLTCGRPYSEMRTGKSAERSFEILKIGIRWPREELYGRINLRVGMMADMGLADEVRALYPKRNLKALQTVGYREMFPFIEGRCSLDEALDAVRMNTRRYAKRQMTWFNRDADILWTEPGDTHCIEKICDLFGE